jgi:hypothetical protein
MTDVEIVERTVAQLTDKRERALARSQQISTERAQIGYAVFAEDDKAARGKLDKLNGEMATLAGEIQSIDGALAEARRRLQLAQRELAIEEDKRQAKEVRRQLVDLLKNAERADQGLAQLVEASGRIRAICQALNALGCANPNHSQVDVLGSIAVRTALGQSIWSRHFEIVPPLSRTTLGAAAAGWAKAIERNIRTRLGEPELKEDQADAAA